MKIDRLIGILAVLQNKKKVTTPYLAEKFEVSRRTIQRDIEDICRAGIPLVTTQGSGGGVSIMEGFQLDASLFTVEELQSILIGLKSLDSVSPIARAENIKEKISVNPNLIPLADHLLIDLSSHYKESLTTKIELIKKAISSKKVVSFHYYYEKGEADKQAEPYLILFKWSDWYLFAYCTQRQAFRLYKLNRLWQLEITEIPFVPRPIPPEETEFDSYFTDTYQITALFEKAQQYRLVETYGVDSFTETETGKLLFRRGFTHLNTAVSWLLSFGDQVEVLGPQEIKEQIKAITRNLVKKYGEE